MLDAVFISDLHLHPTEKTIQEKWEVFLPWVAQHAASLYILGDFFHAWPGDDSLPLFGQNLAEQLAWLQTQGVVVYFMRGNRDFLIGERFLQASGAKFLRDPSVISCGGKSVLLAHGDSFCTEDKKHQLFRRITQNPAFMRFFCRLPLSLRVRLIGKVRSISAKQNAKVYMDVVPATFLKIMQQYQTTILIHGHTHKPGLTTHRYQGENLLQYVLSDWDDIPQALCYDKSKGFYFIHLSEERLRCQNV